MAHKLYSQPNFTATAAPRFPGRRLNFGQAGVGEEAEGGVGPALVV